MNRRLGQLILLAAGGPLMALRAETDGDTRRLDAPKPPLALVVVTGNLDGGQDTVLSPDDEAAARRHVESILGGLLVKRLGFRLADEEVMRQARADAEKWAVLTGGGVAQTRDVLRQFAPDFLVRASIHNSPLTQTRMGTERTGVATFWACASGVTVEVIPRFRDRRPACRASRPSLESVKRLKPLETVLVGLEAACVEAVDALLTDDVFGEAPAPVKASEAPPQFDLTGGKVILVTVGTFAPEGVDSAMRELLRRRFEMEFGTRFGDAFGVRAFDEESLTKARRDAQQWAVLQGGTIEQIREALAPYALDACMRVRFHVPAAARGALSDGEVVFGGTAVVGLEVIRLRGDKGTKALVLESPPMGTNSDPAFKALSVPDAAAGALAYCQRRILERLRGGGEAAATTESSVLADPARPVAAVLWVKPDFEAWRVPRGRQPALTRKHQIQVNKFVKNAKLTGRFGMAVSDYLVRGLTASGALTPLEQAGQIHQDVAGIKNKLLELRMAGWVGERLPYDNPVEAAGQLGATHLVTARIIRVQEPQPTGVGMILASGAKSEVRAWAEVTVSEVATGKVWTFEGEGSMSKTGWSTGIAYTPELQLDETLFGGAVRAALFNAAASVRLE
ncbi:MAG: hypothetical protein RRC34_07905 [Lentisphaeria bacterium]|nr:hypothetical protein [Lentisphaeria bacterium]